MSFNLMYAYIQAIHEICPRGKDGYKMKANDLPSFLYPHGTQYDKDHLDTDLFQGHVLIRVRYSPFLVFPI